MCFWRCDLFYRWHIWGELASTPSFVLSTVEPPLRGSIQGPGSAASFLMEVLPLALMRAGEEPALPTASLGSGLPASDHL